MGVSAGLRATWARAIWPVLLVAAVLAAASARAADPDQPVDVVAHGYVPGFDNREQLTGHLIEVMRQTLGRGWRLRPAPDADAVVQGNAVIWEFRGLASASGSTRYVGPGDRGVLKSIFGGHRPYSIEVRLYLGGAYQATLLRQPSIRGGNRDRALQEAVAALARELRAAAEAN